MKDNKKYEGVLKNFNKMIQDHPFIKLLASAVGLIVIWHQFENFLHNKDIESIKNYHNSEINKLQTTHKIEKDRIKGEHTKEIEEYKNRSLSIERNIGGNIYLNIKNFFIEDKHDIQISNKAEYHPDGKFYASLDESRWERIQGRDIEIFNSMYGEDNPLGGVSSTDLYKFLEVFKITPKSYIWKGRKELLVEGPSPIKRLFPYIQILWKDDREQYASIEAINTYFRKHSRSLMPNEDFKNIEERIFKEDKYLAMIEYDIISNMYLNKKYDNTYYAIKSLQRVKNVFYYKIVRTIEDIVINGEKNKEYYITHEIIGITTPTRTYFVKTTVPSTDPVPRHEYFTWVVLRHH